MRRRLAAAALAVAGLTGTLLVTGAGSASACQSKHVNDGQVFTDTYYGCFDLNIERVNTRSSTVSSATYTAQYQKRDGSWQTGINGVRKLDDGDVSPVWEAITDIPVNTKLRVLANHDAALDVFF